MSKLILVCGSGGSGKTTLAKELSKKLNVVCLHKDSIKEALCYELNFQTPDAYKLFFNLIEEQIKNRVDLIAESPFTFEEDIKMLNRWHEEYGVDLFCVVCKINEATRIQRVQVRSRHDCHKKTDTKLLTTELFDFSKLPGKIINVVTDKPVEELVEEIYNFFYKQTDPYH